MADQAGEKGDSKERFNGRKKEKQRKTIMVVAEPYARFSLLPS